MRRSRLASLATSDHGSSLVELAVALPFLILFAVGAVDYARLYFTGITVANAARAGANYGANPAWGEAEMIAAARAEAGSVTLDSVTAGHYCFCPGTGPGTGVVACTTSTCGTYGVPQAYDSVRVRKDVEMTIKYLGLPESIPIIRSVVLRSQ